MLPPSTTGIPPRSHAHCPGVGRFLLGSSDQASSSFSGSLLEPSMRLSQFLPRDPLNKRDLISTLLDAHSCSMGHIPLRIKQSGLKQGYILASPGEGLMMLSDPTSRLGTLHVGTTAPVPCGRPRPHLSRSPLTSPNSTFLIHWLLYFQVSCITYAAPQPPSLPVLPSPSSGPVWTFVPSLTALLPVCSDVLPSNPPHSLQRPVDLFVFPPCWENGTHIYCYLLDKDSLFDQTQAPLSPLVHLGL